MGLARVAGVRRQVVYRAVFDAHDEAVLGGEGDVFIPAADCLPQFVQQPQFHLNKRIAVCRGARFNCRQAHLLFTGG
ncbi:hypothetical protein SDC9_211017 [bioreactor metagenome]|uniref:Uncharacterized protein n=1 Tax=bioreactor metagenome TaxID=1076179 RepID=A0A645JJH3_9ZZZZ